MNRVLNKDFASESYLNSALISFSDVFHPASCMQSCHVRESKGSNLNSFGMFFFSSMPHLHPTPWNR
jgi:hypothetical protein